MNKVGLILCSLGVGFAILGLIMFLNGLNEVVPFAISLICTVILSVLYVISRIFYKGDNTKRNVQAIKDSLIKNEDSNV